MVSRNWLGLSHHVVLSQKMDSERRGKGCRGNGRRRPKIMEESIKSGHGKETRGKEGYVKETKPDNLKRSEKARGVRAWNQGRKRRERKEKDG